MDASTSLPILVLNELAGNVPARFNALQQLLAPHTWLLVDAWWFVWLITAALLIRYVLLHGVRGAHGPEATYTE